MHRLEYLSMVVLAAVAIAFDGWVFSARCSASPAINVSTLSFGFMIQVIAVGIPLVRGAWFDSASAKNGLKAIGGALILFVTSLMVVRESVLYSDKIGQPNYFRSAGLACQATN